MDLKEIIQEIEKLSDEKKRELFQIISTQLKKRELAIKSLDKIRGAGKGLWNLDAQEYINQMREDRG